MSWLSFFEKKIINHGKGDDITRFDGNYSKHRILQEAKIGPVVLP